MFFSQNFTQKCLFVIFICLLLAVLLLLRAINSSVPPSALGRGVAENWTAGYCGSHWLKPRVCLPFSQGCVCSLCRHSLENFKPGRRRCGQQFSPRSLERSRSTAPSWVGPPLGQVFQPARSSGFAAASRQLGHLI